MLRRILLGTCLFAAGCLAPGCQVRFTGKQPAAEAPAAVAPAVAECAPVYTPTAEDNAFLDELQHRIFNYFWNEVYPETGIAIDHTENRNGKVAATGFELAAVCIGVERGWITRDQGYERALKILNLFWDDPDNPEKPNVDGHFGLWWHFVDGKTGKMMPVDCVAPCDSADFVAGAIVAGEYFKGTEVETLAKKIYDQVQWDRFVAPKPDGTPGLMSFGWVPLHVSKEYYETDGLLDFTMSGFVDNSLLIYILALGSDTHPIPQTTWEQYVDSYTLGEYGGYECLMVGKLFSRQVPESFARLSRKRDRKIDYFQDSVFALLADQAFNMKENGYPPQLWGLTDCFGKDSYSHAAPPGAVMNDGTVGATAFAGALPHVPQMSLDAMRYVREKFGDRAWGKYGFTSSVNQKNDFASPLFVGIELGPMMQLIENYRSGLIWDLFSRGPAMKNFVRRARMAGVVDDFELPPQAPAYATWTVDRGAARVGGDEPQHGRQCLEITAAPGAIRIAGRLTDNDLLEFHFNRHLSLWTRDLDVRACRIAVDGREIELIPEGHLPGVAWDHDYFKLPALESSSRVCAVTIEATVKGPRPALDNVTFEAEADLGAPEAVRDLQATAGRIGGAVDLRWTAPADLGGGTLAKYVLTVTPAGKTGGGKKMEVPAAKPAGQTETRTLLLERGTRYSLTITATDAQGHSSPASAAVEAETNPDRYDPTICDFENGSLDGWENRNPKWTVRVVDDGGNKCLRVDYDKDHAFNHIIARLDPEFVALHRYLTLRVKGNVEILGKLWCRDGFEQDMQAHRAESDTEWTTFKFDTWRAALIVPGRDPVQKLILFPQAGQWSGKGTFFLDDLKYSNE
jgi:hypothetical protein